MKPQPQYLTVRSPFRWMGVPDILIPWRFLEGRNSRAYRNLGQTLEAMEARGGVKASEALAILEDRVQNNWRSESESMAMVKKWLDDAYKREKETKVKHMQSPRTDAFTRFTFEDQEYVGIQDCRGLEIELNLTTEMVDAMKEQTINLKSLCLSVVKLAEAQAEAERKFRCGQGSIEDLARAQTDFQSVSARVKNFCSRKSRRRKGRVQHPSWPRHGAGTAGMYASTSTSLATLEGSVSSPSTTTTSASRPTSQSGTATGRSHGPNIPTREWPKCTRPRSGWAASRKAE